MVYKATKNLNLSRNNKAIFSDKCSTYCFLTVNAEVLRQNCFPRPSARPTLRLSHVNSIPLSLGRSMVILFYKQKRLTNFALLYGSGGHAVFFLVALSLFGALSLVRG